MNQNWINGGKCPDIEALSAFAEGTMPEEEGTFLREHLITCDLCLREVFHIKRTLKTADGQMINVPKELQEKVLQTVTAENLGKEAKWNLSEFVFSFGKRGISFISNILLPEGARFEVLYPSPLPATIFRNGRQQENNEIIVEETFGDISIKILFVQSVWPTLNMKVTVNKKESACMNKRVSLYLGNALLSSKATSTQGTVDFPDITLGNYSVRVPQEAIELRIRLNPEEGVR
jgi:hypothetical protein